MANRLAPADRINDGKTDANARHSWTQTERSTWPVNAHFYKTERWWSRCPPLLHSVGSTRWTHSRSRRSHRSESTERVPRSRIAGRMHLGVEYCAGCWEMWIHSRFSFFIFRLFPSVYCKSLLHNTIEAYNFAVIFYGIMASSMPQDSHHRIMHINKGLPKRPFRMHCTEIPLLETLNAVEIRRIEEDPAVGWKQSLTGGHNKPPRQTELAKWEKRTCGRDYAL